MGSTQHGYAAYFDTNDEGFPDVESRQSWERARSRFMDFNERVRETWVIRLRERYKVGSE